MPHGWGPLAGAPQATRARGPALPLQRVWRQAELVAEPAQQLKPAETGHGRQRRQIGPLIPPLEKVGTGPADGGVLGAPTGRSRGWTQVRAQRVDGLQDGLVE